MELLRLVEQSNMQGLTIKVTENESEQDAPNLEEEKRSSENAQKH